MRAAVVGTGIHGACAALALARRGHSVTVYDRHPPGHGLGSSHGRSRIIRKAYPDAFYTGIMSEAYGLWGDLQARSADRFVHPVGLLYFGLEDSPTLRGVHDALDTIGVPMEMAGPGQTFCPELRLGAGEVGIFTPEAGWVHAHRAVRSILAMAQDLGARFELREIESAAELESESDAVVVAPGAWIRRFADLPVTVRVQTVGYVAIAAQGAVWIEDGPEFLYGFPVAPGERGAKIGVHQRGIEWDLMEPRPGPDAASVDAIADFVARRYGSPAPIVETATCLYAMTPDEDFRWGRCGERSWYVSACSGHGFKFGPWIGERMADFAEGSLEPESVPRFCQELRERGS